MTNVIIIFIIVFLCLNAQLHFDLQKVIMIFEILKRIFEFADLNCNLLIVA